MKTTKSRTVLLSEYAFFAAVFLAGQNAKADIVYTDVDPDIVLDVSGEQAMLDMDNNGTDNFGIHFTKGLFQTYYYSNTIYKKSVWCTIDDEVNNQLAGSSFVIGDAQYSSYYTFRPYAIPDNFAVNVMLSFQDAGWQKMAELKWDIDGGPEFFSGHWTPPVDEKYLGARFTGEDGYMHYGWVRCMEVDSLDAFIIKDYAYESVPGRPIITGMTSGTSLSVDENKAELSELYSNGNILYLSGSLLQQNAEVNIFNLQGQLVFTDFIFIGNTSLILPQLKGDFLVQYISGQQKITRKIFIY